MNKIKCYIKNYIQPFERILAFHELEILAGKAQAIESDDTNSDVFVIETAATATDLAKLTTYWESFDDGVIHISKQVKREQSYVGKNDNGQLKKRRYLRYGPHGIHEYRGKFFPQLVRSLLTIGKVPLNGIVLDPMCGSGTTAVETVVSGRTALAIDMNPLSVMLTDAKCGSIFGDNSEIRKWAKVVSDLLRRKSTNDHSGSYFESIPKADQKYLSNWFEPYVLVDLDKIMDAIHKVDNDNVQKIFKISLSNIIRSVSWQRESDLRVRRKECMESNVCAIDLFLNEISKSVANITAFNDMNDQILGSYTVSMGDAKNMSKIFGAYRGLVDCVITSPPYATALPYLDTDRLSLIYLGLMSRATIRKTDKSMIGNREITKQIKGSYWDFFLSHRDDLPEDLSAMLIHLDRLYSQSHVGFRRQNLPSLLAKYFYDIKSVFESIHELVKDNAPVFFVVGNNHTITSEGRYEIDTVNHIAKIANACGLILVDQVSMDMLVSRDVFKKNAVASEMILHFKNKL